MSDFMDPCRKIEVHGEKIPHWQQDGTKQFVTFRLKDAMPDSKIRQWKEERTVWISNHPKPWSEEDIKEHDRLFTWRIENWLDEGAGSCILSDPENRAPVATTLMNDQATRAEHHAFVIMPNHVHLLFTQHEKLEKLEKLMKCWKGVSARRIGHGSIWQKRYRDTMIRDGKHFANAVRYIRKNPAKLREGTFTLWESDRAKAIL